MKRIDINAHNFQKINLVSLKNGYDKYKCAICGIVGKRHGFVEYIVCTDSEYKKSLICTYAQVSIIRPKKVKIENDMPHIGILAGEHTVVEAPKEYSKYANDVWIFSEKRWEAVRLLSNEYKAIN